jgi:hypothetical protein
VDVTDENLERALDSRDEILHNGYFLTRWHSQAPEKQQERFSDVQRLRRLTLLIIFRRTGYAGTFVDPVTFQTDRLEAFPLPQALYEQ